jgi:hypothetical protein
VKGTPRQSQVIRFDVDISWVKFSRLGIYYLKFCNRNDPSHYFKEP